MPAPWLSQGNNRKNLAEETTRDLFDFTAGDSENWLSEAGCSNARQVMPPKKITVLLESWEWIWGI